jgi:nitrogen fixation protein FixH
VQVAAGGTSSLERRSAGLWANARITNKCRISRTGAGRVFTCATRLRAGTWVVTTEARNGATVIASSSSTWMLVATSKPKHMPVTG